jgi:hypothetical protein
MFMTMETVVPIIIGSIFMIFSLILAVYYLRKGNAHELFVGGLSMMTAIVAGLLAMQATRFGFGGEIGGYLFMGISAIGVALMPWYTKGCSKSE